MRIISSIFILFSVFQSCLCYAQVDTIIPNITAISLKFIEQTNTKIDKYSNRITSKTEKTLEKLTKWENKIKGLLQKADPATAERLFGNRSKTFAAMLQKVRDGKALTENYKAKYDEYRDKLTTNIKYIETQKENLGNKYIQPLQQSTKKIAALEKDVAETETAQTLIKERKKELLAEAYKILGKSKYHTKINKETYYYTESLKNYKQIFNEPGKAEETAINVLNKIPAVKEFLQKNSMLAGLFGSQSSSASAASLAGLQTRADVNNLLQSRIAAGGPNAAAQISANMQAAQAQLKQLKDKIIKSGSGSSDTEIPDFKPIEVKTKTFKQRLEFGSNFQFGKPTRFASSQADLGMSVGYKLNDKSIVGFGMAYKLNYGPISSFYLQHGGIGARSFVDYKLKKQFFISGGFEMNYTNVFTNLRGLQSSNDWQSSGLIGITKKIKLKTKYVKGTNFQVLYDFLYKTHVVPTQPVVFRVGYNF